MSNPLTQNLYTYCAGDPVNRVDPSGHSWLGKMFKKAAKKIRRAAKKVKKAAKKVKRAAKKAKKAVKKKIKHVKKAAKKLARAAKRKARQAAKKAAAKARAIARKAKAAARRAKAAARRAAAKARKAAKSVAKKAAIYTIATIVQSHPFVAKEVSGVVGVLKKGLEGKDQIYTSSAYGSAAALLGVSVNAGYGVSSKGDVCLFVSTSAHEGTSFGVSAGNKTSYIYSSNINDVGGCSRSFGAGGSIGGVFISGERNELFDDELKDIDATGYSYSIGAGAGWNADVSMSKTYMMRIGNIKRLFK